MLVAHVLAPFRQALEDGRLVRKVKSLISFSILHNAHDLQHEGLATAVGLRETLLQQFIPLLECFLFWDQVLLLFVVFAESYEATES